jgi:hypothetical protein
MANIKQVCCICEAHISGKPTAKLISHGLCEVCAKATLDTFKGKMRHVKFWNPDNDKDHFCVAFNYVDREYIDKMSELGYTRREVVL